MEINTQFFERCIGTLEKAFELSQKVAQESIDHDLYRAACVKEFEIILEQSGKLLKKALRPFFHSSRAADRLFFKDIFRHAALHGLVSQEACERWLEYRDNRNNTAHDYGANFAEEIMEVLPQFIVDSRDLVEAIKSVNRH